MGPTRHERSLTRRRVSLDGRTRRTMGLALFVCVGSLLDALGTLHHVHQGGEEANPVLALALTSGPWLFLLLKLGLTGVGVCALAVHHQVPLAQRGLQGLALSYGGVLLMHLALALRLV